MRVKNLNILIILPASGKINAKVLGCTVPGVFFILGVGFIFS